MRLAIHFLLAVLVAACGRHPLRPASDGGVKPTALATHEGAFERRLLLTGEIDAVSAADLRVPRVPMGRVTVRWLVSDGALVQAGDKLAELDNANFVAQVRERALTVSQSETELKRQQWQNELEEGDRALEVQRQRTALRRAELDADVPPGILPRRDFLVKQLAVRKAKADLEKAENTLSAQRRTAALDLAVKRIGLEKVQRELHLAEQMIEALTLRAPAAGTVIIGDHWEGRKLQIGDELPVGHVVARLPDLQQIRVKAWLSDVDDGKVAVGMPAQIFLDASPDRALAAKVLEIAAGAREVSERSLRRVFQVDLAIESTEGEQSRPGMSARVEVIADRRPRAVLVPREVLLGEGTAVALANGGRQAITLGPCDAKACVVSDGLRPGIPLRRAQP